MLLRQLNVNPPGNSVFWPIKSMAHKRHVVRTGTISSLEVRFFFDDKVTRVRLEHVVVGIVKELAILVYHGR